MNEAATKLYGVRHYCFQRGVLARHPDADYLQAFRTLNRLYVEARRDALKGQRITGKPPATRSRKAA